MNTKGKTTDSQCHAEDLEQTFVLQAEEDRTGNPSYL